MNVRIVALLYAVFIPIYVGFIASMYSNEIADQIYLSVSAVLFLVAFFSVHTYFKVQSIEDLINKKTNKTKKSNKIKKKR